MSDHTKIEWADATVNAVNGCSVTSPGCTNCYAMRLAGTRMKHHPSRQGLTIDSKAGPVWTGEVRLHEPALLQPLRWKRPRRIFWNAHGDLFHPAVPDEWIDRVFAICALTPQHTHMILTKRSARMREYVADVVHRSMSPVLDYMLRNERPERHWPGVGFGFNFVLKWPLPNVWLGVSVEDQARRDRVLDLAQTPAALRFISAEPLLSGLTLTDVPLNGGPDEHGDQWLFNALTGEQYFLGEDGRHYSGDGPDMQPLDWVIVGGESGPGARPMHPEWARSLRDQCAAAGVPFHFKQWGEHIAHPAPNAKWPDGSPVPADLSPVTFERVGKARAGRLLDGVERHGFPQVRP